MVGGREGSGGGMWLGLCENICDWPVKLWYFFVVVFVGRRSGCEKEGSRGLYMGF
jgi:hypothetical protein